ncbi:MAG: hypothetical protein JXA94_01635, partial [Parachlamydiales bacterium]|nr:hypothetical protein [Parachlamydiales bacterium]
MQQVKSRQITYQTRIKNFDKKTEEILSSCANLLSILERKLFSDLMKGKKINDLKKEYIKNHQITARQFNSIRFQIEGKIRSFYEIKKSRIFELNQKIKNLEKTIPKYKNPNKIHQKKRSLFNLKTRLKNLENQKNPKICFGSKKLFNKQFRLKENGFEDFEKWKEKWQKQRNNSFFIVGSKDETAGNQSCQVFKDNNKLSLKLRLPNKFSSKYGKYLTIKDIFFEYGQDEIIAAIENNDKRKEL